MVPQNISKGWGAAKSVKASPRQINHFSIRNRREYADDSEKRTRDSIYRSPLSNRERTSKRRFKLDERPFLAQFSTSLGLRHLKFREEFEYGLNTLIQTTFLSSNETIFLSLIIGPKGPFLFDRLRKSAFVRYSEEMRVSYPKKADYWRD